MTSPTNENESASTDGNLETKVNQGGLPNIEYEVVLPPIAGKPIGSWNVPVRYISTMPGVVGPTVEEWESIRATVYLDSDE